MSDKTRKYILYAIGEILLVVIGILIALQVNNWNEIRKERADELSYLNRLLEEVERDSSSLNSNIYLTDLKVNQAESVLHHIKNKPSISDSTAFIRDVFLIGRGGSFRPYIPAYQELLSTGKLDIITNTSITEQLARYINRVEGMESFVYAEGEKRRSEYMSHVHTYFNAMIMDYIWEMGDPDSLEMPVLRELGVDIENYISDPVSVIHSQNVAALNKELNRLYNQHMNRYSISILTSLRQEIDKLE